MKTYAFTLRSKIGEIVRELIKGRWTVIGRVVRVKKRGKVFVTVVE